MEGRGKARQLSEIRILLQETERERMGNRSARKQQAGGVHEPVVLKLEHAPESILRVAVHR